MNKQKLQDSLKSFFLEDIGDGDVTSEAIFHHTEQGELILLAKEDGIFCGVDVIREGFHLLDQSVTVQVFKRDSDPFMSGETLAVIRGPVLILLRGERVILNLVQRLSGIATRTREAVTILQSDKTRIVDTRKTTPGLRMLEKYAVRCGGGFNHRFGLYDAVMIKDNHIAFAGSITKAVTMVKRNLGHMMKVEVEIETEGELAEAILAGADVIMFDNRSPDQIKSWIQQVPSGVITEASGGITLENLPLYRDTGVNYISLGCLTHSVQAVDISAKVELGRREQEDELVSNAEEISVTT